MRKSLGAKPFIYPQPVLIIGTYQDNGEANAMNAAWGGIVDVNRISIALSMHNSTANILKRKAFTVSMATSKEVIACDFVGVVSMNKDSEKMKKTGWHEVRSEVVDAPYFEELPLTLECELVSYDEESEILIGEIKNVLVDEAILDENGKIDVAKLDVICFDPSNHGYYTLGSKVGNAFKDGFKLK